MKRKINILFTAAVLSGMLSASVSAQDYSDIKFDDKEELKYAEYFDIAYAEDGYKLITVNEDEKYLIVPQDLEVPDDIPDDITVLEQPLDNIYLTAESAMSLISDIGERSAVKLTGISSDSWSDEEIQKEMDNGDILFAGKYSKPDYEMLLSENAYLSISSTMLNHVPEVKDKLAELGIKMFIDYSGYESHPLGRTEWIKLYGAMFNKEEEAQKLFDIQDEDFNSVIKESSKAKKELTIAYFYINSSGQAVTRKPEDYVAKMIEYAGGKYMIQDWKSEDKLSTIKLEMEQFYDIAKDADIIIYSGTMNGSINSIDELIEKNSLTADFKAVKNKNVWCTGKDMYQASDRLGQIMEELNGIITGKDSADFEYFVKVE